jgi:hypothetical protein
MIIGEETSTASTATNNIYHIPLYTLILNRNIVRVLMGKLFHFQPVAEDVEDPKKEVIVTKLQGLTLELKTSSKNAVEGVVRLTHFLVFLRFMKLCSF